MEQSAPVHHGPTISVPVVGQEWWRCSLWNRVFWCTMVSPLVFQWSDQHVGDSHYAVECFSALWSDQQCSSGPTSKAEIPTMEQSA
jgi:hypothetical protein